MLKFLKLSQHKHTGKVIEHHNTSYVPLVLLLLFTGFVLSVFTVTAQSPGPEAGSVGLSGVMPGPPPDQAPTITSPSNNQRFTVSPVTIKGTCPKNTLVEVFKNDIFAGSTFCSESGTYSFDIDLLFGRNVLLARSYDALNQSSPESNKVTVFYDSQLAQPDGFTGVDFGAAQLILNTDAVYRGIFPGKQMSMPLTVLGGQAPYAVRVQWGDGTDSLVSRNSSASFRTTHTYKKPGTFQISIQATDKEGRVAFITVAAIVNGQPEGVVIGAASAEAQNILITLWPLYISVVAVLIAFWLGERREKQVLEKRGELIHRGYPYTTPMR
jgi:hypothetical protein